MPWIVYVLCKFYNNKRNGVWEWITFAAKKTDNLRKNLSNNLQIHFYVQQIKNIIFCMSNNKISQSVIVIKISHFQIYINVK